MTSTSSLDSPLAEGPLETAPASAPGLTPTAPRRPFHWLDWAREPLVHFVLLGGLLFAVDHFLVGKKDDPNLIVVDAVTDNEAIETFKAARGHAPNQEELAALRRVWLDNEVLYRQGLSLGVDKGDTAIRERVIFKALSLIDGNVKLPPVNEAVLRQWFDGHRDKYDDPVRYDFEEAALTGDVSEAAVRAFVDALNAGAPGDAKAGLRVFKGRPQSNLVQSYGATVAETLAKAEPGRWLAVSTREGWRAMRVKAVTPAKPADFVELRGIILQDWTDATASEQRSAAVRALTQKYTVKYEPSKP